MFLARLKERGFNFDWYQIEGESLHEAALNFAQMQELDDQQIVQVRKAGVEDTLNYRVQNTDGTISIEFVGKAWTPTKKGSH